MSGVPALGLLCRPPRVARTRLEPIIGEERALDLARVFLQDSVALCREVAWRASGRFKVFHTPAAGAAEVAELVPGADLVPLTQEDQCLRRELAAAHLFAEGAGEVVLLDYDTPTLPPALIELLFDALRSGADAACIPSLDGGVCAIGLARPLPVLFRGMPWNTPELLGAIRAKARAEGLDFRELQFWHDVDHADDLKLLQAGLDGLAPPHCSPLPPFAATATRRLLGG
ncbi:TIGR04282 family arsenosugar biosynthesis glycosyltransferase [Roseococcus pinisoli]|uniref:DUF2064 domain-containing protein n=1 Tax=Roseococcus pinisoli TaxID=2835040 RepID=A0ABS5QD36_9PROT|nr:DUF2064 domain-containing protein [Roseococcus pinisoli]MBS7811393.1 DUF2064 domain-containing protein [Roseococcus pinisoli]